MLHIAMSCYQGRTQDAAWDAVTALLGAGLDGVQLTPGNLPSTGFRERVEGSGVATRRHHGFSWTRYRRTVWRAGRAAFVDPGRSVHPPGHEASTDGGMPAGAEPVAAGEGPVAAGAPGATLDGVLDEAKRAGWALETMYPGQLLGTGGELRRAMAAGAGLAVDVSHLWIQRCSGVLDDVDLRAVLDYDGIVEVHLSDNDGRSDRHTLLSKDTFLLDWARGKGAHGVPLVWESYLHGVDADTVRRQLDLLAPEG